MAIIVKTTEQIEGIRRSCRLAAETLRMLEHFIAPGQTTEIINQEAEAFIRARGAVPAPLGYKGFPKATCTSLNEVICHGIPSRDAFLKEGDILNVDVTTILDGYYGDASTMFAIGRVNEQAERLLRVTRECLDVGVQQVRPGAPFWAIGFAIEPYALARGFSVVYQFGGHGVGLAFHEEPVITHNYDTHEARVMRPGHIFTIEPMICQGSPDARVLEDGWTAVTADGLLSAQCEHTVLCTDDGVEVLTA